MWWVLIVIIVIIVLVVWVIAGGSVSGGSPIQGCNGCDELAEWWNGLSKSQKVLQKAWYETRKAYCHSNCPQ
jgi:hypothetical protein